MIILKNDKPIMVVVEEIEQSCTKFKSSGTEGMNEKQCEVRC